MNLALRTVRLALGMSGGAPVEVWRRYAARLAAVADRTGAVEDVQVRAAAREVVSPGVAVGEWTAALRHLGVLRAANGSDEVLRFDSAAAAAVATALDLGGDALLSERPRSSWTPVVTIPESLERRHVAFPVVPRTAGVLLEIIEQAQHELWLAAPFLDEGGIEFLAPSIRRALQNDVLVTVLTSPGHSEALSAFAVGLDAKTLTRLHVYEAAFPDSDLGSHAKVVLCDDRLCYLGSANLTRSGFGRHLELGARLEGPGVRAVAEILQATTSLGRRVSLQPSLSVPPRRRAAAEVITEAGGGELI